MKNNNKVYVLPPGENWIVDRFVKEWNSDNEDISVHDPSEADVIWLLADWCYNQLDMRLLQEKKVITTVHHIVPEKFYHSRAALAEFQRRDNVTDVYHVYNRRTEEFIKPLTIKPIKFIPYWANQSIWFPTGVKGELRKKLRLPDDAYIIGSFQRDTEGHDLISPKLEKGPDLFADAVDKYNDSIKNVHVLLGGWRRQYVINELKRRKVPFTYIELPPQEVVNEMYQTLDLYAVTARHEGGPQSLIECGLLDVPCVSTPVGIAEQILPHSSINIDVTQAKPSVPNVENWVTPIGYIPYRELIQSL